MTGHKDDDAITRVNIMCIICIEFQRSRDLADARRMLAAARREPTAIGSTHLDEVEAELKAAADEEDASA
jgi:hypothetical protein